MTPPLVGILSDSHGDAAATARAVAILTERGVVQLFHCGDICGEAVLDELAGHPCSFVWGNCDSPTPALNRYGERLGLCRLLPPQRIELAEKCIAVFHGHERGFDAAAGGDGLDYLFYGHTHRFGDHRVGNCRLINPGALYRAKPRTCATLNLATGELVIIRIDTGERVSSARTVARHA